MLNKALSKSISAALLSAMTLSGLAQFSAEAEDGYRYERRHQRMSDRWNSLSAEEQQGAIDDRQQKIRERRSARQDKWNSLSESEQLQAKENFRGRVDEARSNAQNKWNSLSEDQQQAAREYRGRKKDYRQQRRESRRGIFNQ